MLFWRERFFIAIPLLLLSFFTGNLIEIKEWALTAVVREFNTFIYRQNIAEVKNKIFE